MSQINPKPLQFELDHEIVKPMSEQNYFCRYLTVLLPMMQNVTLPCGVREDYSMSVTEPNVPNSTSITGCCRKDYPHRKLGQSFYIITTMFV